MPVPVECVIMRGGTSKAVFLKDENLPRDPSIRDRSILSIFGSPDRRQIDGLGGADPLTSKLAVIGRPSDDTPVGADLTYTFGQVEIDGSKIDYHSLCGNISSAVGAFAVYEGLVEAVSPVTKVKVFNTNLQRILTIEVPVTGRYPEEVGDYEVPGVPCSKVLGGQDLLDDPHVRERGLVLEIDHPLLGKQVAIGAPWRIDDRVTAVRAAPALGEHTADVLHDWLGLDSDEVARLAEAGAVEMGTAS